MKGVALTYLDPGGRRPEATLDLGSDCQAEPFRFLYLGDEQNSIKLAMFAIFSACLHLRL